VDTDAHLPDGPHEFHRPEWYNFLLDEHLRWRAEAERQIELLFAA
jgi:hypothetical protein